MKIPSDTTVAISGNVITVKGPKGELTKEFDSRKAVASMKGEEFVVELKAKKPTRSGQALAGAIEAHVRNMVKGVHEAYEKKLQLVFAHFPVSVEVKGKDVFIKNFLGEKIPRKAKVIGDVKVEVKGQDIKIIGNDKEDVGQTASNIVKATRIIKKDIRIFQDGIYYA